MKEAPAQTSRYATIDFLKNLVNWTYSARTDPTLVFRRWVYSYRLL